MFRPINDYNFHNKRTLLRCDFNVPVHEERILDDFKIQKALFTIKYLKSAGAKIIILSHFGAPNDFKSQKEAREKCTLKPIHKRLEELLQEKIEFTPEIAMRAIVSRIKKMNPGDMLMLENLRFHREEENNSPAFAEELARLGEVYVGEHFSVCHRNNASVALLPTLLPHFAGPALLKEIEMLSRVFDNPPRPLVAVIGGSKIASKIKAASSLLKSADFLLLGGKIANTILTVKGLAIGKPWPDENTVQLIRRFTLTDTKIYLPVDVLASSDDDGKELVRDTAPGMVRIDENIFDIGAETIYTFSEIIKTAGAIFWVGPLGLYEQAPFSKGTKAIAEAIVNSPAELKVLGGGETVTAVRLLGLSEGFDFISAGGGAMLAFLAKERMPGLEALKSN